jgi:uncharacterized protein
MGEKKKFVIKIKRPVNLVDENEKLDKDQIDKKKIDKDEIDNEKINPKMIDDKNKEDKVKTAKIKVDKETGYEKTKNDGINGKIKIKIKDKKTEEEKFENKKSEDNKIDMKNTEDKKVSKNEEFNFEIKSTGKKSKKSQEKSEEETFSMQYQMPYLDFVDLISQRLSLKRNQVENTVKLLDDENTVPFIARYRKEMTGSLDEVQIRAIEKQINYERNLYQRKTEVLSSILSQGKLTEELEKKILSSEKLSEVEELYLPYKPKRKTRAAKAIEKGLAPLAEMIKKNLNPEVAAKDFINSEKGVANVEEALAGAMDIIAEEFAEFFEVRNLLRQTIIDTGSFEVKKKNPQEKDEFDMYKDYKEPVKTIKNHRILAINRGETKDKLSVKVTIDDEFAFKSTYNLFVNKNQYFDNKWLNLACEDGYKRLLLPSIISDIRQNLTEKAEKEAITVFAKNLFNLLLTPPLKNRRILAIDPGIRTGSKVAALDEFGNYLDDTKIYQEDEEQAIETLEKLVKKYKIELIAIGNGTASRDVEKLVAKAIKEKDLKCKFLIVPETGASVYSASDVAREEFPELDVTVRGAISIGRRVLDPLTEYVKIDPKSLGVGQYQHDVNQRELSKTLDEIVEDAVNKVGVFLNTASVPLLKHVSGISERVAKNIVDYRLKHGPFKSRFDLLKVPGVGEKVFTQAAGFLRIPESPNKLDNSWIHPESYPIAEELLKIMESGKELKEEIALEIAEKYGKSKETIHDILEDFKKPGRDPREDIEAPILKADVLTIEDLKEGMVLKGTVRNVTDFGAFVDIGIKNDGLVHISELSDSFVGDPLNVVQVGQIVEVRVIEIDKERGRVSLSMKKESAKSQVGSFSKNSKINIENKDQRPYKQVQQRGATFGDLFKNK